MPTTTKPTERRCHWCGQAIRRTTNGVWVTSLPVDPAHPFTGPRYYPTDTDYAGNADYCPYSNDDGDYHTPEPAVEPEPDPTVQELTAAGHTITTQNRHAYPDECTAFNIPRAVEACRLGLTEPNNNDGAITDPALAAMYGAFMSDGSWWNDTDECPPHGIPRPTRH